MLTLKGVKQNLYLFINVLFIDLYLTLKLNNHLMNLNNCN